MATWALVGFAVMIAGAIALRVGSDRRVTSPRLRDAIRVVTTIAVFVVFAVLSMILIQRGLMKAGLAMVGLFAIYSTVVTLLGLRRYVDRNPGP